MGKRQIAGFRDEPPVVLVTEAGLAEGAPGAAAALACAAAGRTRTSLLIDLCGRTPRRALLTSSLADELAGSLRKQIACGQAAARGRVCFLGMDVTVGPLETAVAAIAVAHLRRNAVVVLVEGAYLCDVIDDLPSVTGVLLQADPREEAETAKAIKGLRERGTPFEVLTHRLGWEAERRASYGSLPPDAPDGLSPALACRLLGSWSVLEERTAVGLGEPRQKGMR